MQVAPFGATWMFPFDGTLAPKTISRDEESRAFSRLGSDGRGVGVGNWVADDARVKEKRRIVLVWRAMPMGDEMSMMVLGCRWLVSVNGEE